MTDRDSEPSTPQEDDASVQSKDTVPPPESGDAYSAMTAVREVPPAVLQAIRKRKLEEAVKKADAQQEKKAAEKAGEIVVDMRSEPVVRAASEKPAAPDAERAPPSPIANALAPAPLPRIAGYTVPGPAEEEELLDEVEPIEETSLSIRPKITEVEAEHADPSILAIEAAAPTAVEPAVQLTSPFAPSPRRMAENVTLLVLAFIAMAAGWILSALFR